MRSLPCFGVCLLLLVGPVGALKICDWAKSTYRSEQAAFACYVGAFLTEAVPSYTPSITTISYIQVRLLPYLGGTNAINSLLTDDPTETACLVCYASQNIYNEVTALRVNLTHAIIADYEALQPCYVQLTARVLGSLTTSADGIYLQKDRYDPTNPFAMAKRIIKALLLDKNFDDSSCPLSESASTDTVKDGLKAAMWGAISAFSFPLGAGLALLHIPNPRTVGMLMGFGNGALLCALSVEMFGSSEHSFAVLSEQGKYQYAELGLTGVLLGAVSGCLIFIFLNRKLSNMSAPTHSTRTRSRTRSRSILGVSSPLMRSLEQGAQEHSYLSTASENREVDKPAPAPSLQVPSEFSLLTGSHSIAGLEKWDELGGASSATTAMSVWLGVLVDGIPEAMVIGFMTKQDRISYGFVVGVFLSNFPEALSAASLMRSRYTGMKILVLWGSLMVMTSFLAGLTAFAMPGRICVHNIDWEYVIRETIEGIAAGAMLCMLVCVAIPESFHLANDIAGLFTLLGFLATLLVIAITHEASDDGFSCI